MSTRGKTVFRGGILSDNTIQGKTSIEYIVGTSTTRLSSNYPSNTTFDVNLQTGNAIDFVFPIISTDDIGKEFDFYVQDSPGTTTGAFIRFTTSTGSVLKGIATCTDSTLEIRDAVRIDITEQRYLGGTLIKAKIINETQISFQIFLTVASTFITITS